MLQLKCTGWMVHEALDLRIPDDTIGLVVGANMAGKTALRDAVEFALLGTGTLRGIGTKKELGALSIADGAQECEVALTVGPGRPTHVVRAMDRTGAQTLKVATWDGQAWKSLGGASLRERQDRLLHRLGLGERQVLAVLGAEHLFGLHPNERRAMLLDAAGTALDADQVASALEGRELAGPLREIADQVAAEGFRAAEHDVVEKRRAAKQRMQDAAPLREPERHFRPEGAEQPVDLGKITERQIRDRLAMYRDSGAAKQAEEASTRAKAEAVLEQAQAEIRACSEELEALDQLPELPEDAADLLAEHGDLAIALGAAGSVVHGARSTLAGHEQAAEAAREILRSAGRSEITKPEICPAIPGDFPCPATKAKLAAHRKTLEERAGKARDDLARAEADVEWARGEVARWEGAAKAIEARLRAEHEQGQRREALSRRLQVAEDRAEALSRELEAHPVEKAGAGDFTRARIAQGEAVLDAKLAYDRHVKEAAERAARREAAEAEVAQWDALAQALKPDGIESDLAARQLGRVHQVLRAWGTEGAEDGDAVRVTHDFTFELQHEGTWRRWQQLSESARLRLGYAVQYLLARLAGFPLLVLDGFDHLDPAHRRRTLQMLRGARVHFGAVLVLATLNRATPQPAPFADVATYWLHDGTVETVGKDAA